MPNLTGQAKGALREIDNKLDWIVRMLDDVEGRYERASDAVSYLCAEVQRFLDDPDAVGYDALAAARRQVLSLRAGNFSPPSVDQPETVPA